MSSDRSRPARSHREFQILKFVISKVSNPEILASGGERAVMSRQEMGPSPRLAGEDEGGRSTGVAWCQIPLGSSRGLASSLRWVTRSLFHDSDKRPSDATSLPFGPVASVSHLELGLPRECLEKIVLSCRPRFSRRAFPFQPGIRSAKRGSDDPIG